jgi:ATP-binding cassette, subfamily F, member 3
MNAQIVLEKVGIRYTKRVLFEDVNWTLYDGMRVALAGRNGSGKSTLMRIIAGHGDPSEGRRTVVGSRRLRIGYLDQTLLDSAVVEALGLKDKTLSAVNFIQNRLLKIDEDHENSPEELEWETRKTLSGLGFSTAYMDSPISHLSGGWLLRVFIAAALLEKPEVLLLDEPTNHLDISSIQWLEEFLANEYEGSLILITHDVALQKRTTDSLAIVHGGRFYFKKHQRDYLTFRDSLSEEKRLLERNIESVEKKIDENMAFVEKFRAKAQTAARAQSKLRMAEAFQEELVELKDRLERIEGFGYNLKFRFRLSEAGPKFPISTKTLDFRYNENTPWILKDVNIDIKRGQKIAIIGDNGAGKTTLLNVLAERLKPTNGEIVRGGGTHVGYFGQHQLDELSLEDTVLDNLRVKATGVGLEQMRGWLGAFGFHGNEEIGKKTKVLSGGERARLALLRILVTPINVCLLDEPTNHLDIETKELLKGAIREFEGTTILVSHDREFISGLAERILYVSNDHKITDHLGDLNSFFEKFPERVRHVEGGHAKPSTPAAQEWDEEPEEKKSSGQNLSYEERKKIRNLTRSLEKKIAAAEEEMERLGNVKNELAQNPTNDSFKQMAALDAQIHAKMLEWERWSEELETLKQKVQ